MKKLTARKGPARRSDGRRRVLWGVVVMELLLGALAARTISRETTYPLYLASYLAMAAVWIAGSFFAVRETTSRATDRAFVLGVALALRLLFLPGGPVLSDDVFRYVWDGRVQKAGINPYLYAPSDPALAPLRDELYAGINNKEIPTIYPPLMQAAFLVATSISESVLWMKTFFVVFDLALIWALMGLLSRLSLNPLRALVYAWSPLAVVEVAGSGHNDVLAVFLLVVCLSALEKRHRIGAMLLLAGSGLAKLLGFALAPLFARSVRPVAYGAMAVGTFVVVFPYRSAGMLSLRGLSEYASRWRGNDSLFHLLFVATGSLERAKLLVAALLVGLVLFLLWRNTRPVRSCYWTLGAVLLFMPTVHPWYLLWVLPFLALYPNPAWMYLSASVALSYHAAYLAPAGAPWEDLLWVKVLEYVPFFALLGLDLRFHDTGTTSGDPGSGRVG